MTTFTPDVRARRPRINLWLVAVIALAAGLVAMAAWALVDRGTGSGGTEAAQMLDDLNTAVNAGDATAVGELFTRDAAFVTPDGSRISGLDKVVSAALIPHASGLRVERVAPVTTEGNLAATFISYPGGIELVAWQSEDGKIARLWVYAPG